MKTSIKHLAIALAAALQLVLHASVPLAWDVRPGQPAPVMFDRYHGEVLDFSATFRGFGDLPFAPDADVRLWYQTNGMGAAWWSAPATVQSNVLSATWSPALDPGADRVSLFFGAPSNAYASAILRLRHSPGFAPGAIPDPESFHESDPVFSSWLATFEVPETSLEPSTNYTDRVVADFARTNEVVSGGPYLALTGGVLRAQGDANIRIEGAGASLGGMPAYVELAPMGIDVVGPFGGNWLHIDGLGFRMDNLFGYGGLFSFPYEAYETGGTIALRSDLPDTASITNDIADIRTESALVYRLYSGSNVVAEVTNYNSQVHAPSLRLLQLNESNEYITVWTETNGLARTLAAATNYADEAISSRAAPRAWSGTTSGLGAEAPSNTTWISTPTTVIAGGFEYAKFVDSYGEVWVLTSNGMAAEFNPDTNAYFRITADDGTPVFSIEKSDSQVVGAHASGITVGATTITIPVPVVSVTAPTMYWRQYLDSGDWADESSPPTGATVSWSGTAGSWVCTVSFSGTRPSSMFFKFSFIQEGGVVIRNNATTDLSTGIWVNGVKFIPSVSGNNLIWTKQ